MIARVRPEKMRSEVIIQLPSRVVPAVSGIGLVRSTTLRIIASRRARPSVWP